HVTGVQTCALPSSSADNAFRWTPLRDRGHRTRRCARRARRPVTARGRRSPERSAPRKTPEAPRGGPPESGPHGVVPQDGTHEEWGVSSYIVSGSKKRRPPSGERP